MSFSVKLKSAPIDDKHMIRDPLAEDDPQDIKVWMDTLKRTRIKELFLSVARLEGHVKQLQQELLRITPEKLSGHSWSVCEAAYAAQTELRSSLKKAVLAAEEAGFPFLNLYVHFPLLNDYVFF